MVREQRKDNRVITNWAVRLGKRGSGVAQGRVKNASISGLYVETALALNTGDRILLEIHIEKEKGSKPILCEALVMRKDTVIPQYAHGYGVQFTRIDDDSLQRLFTVVTELWSAQQR